MPSGVTEYFQPISFPIPLANVLGEAEATVNEPGIADGCEGGAQEPKAVTAPGKPGHLCVYVQEAEEATVSGIDKITLTQGGANVFGGVIMFEIENAGAYAFGSWSLSGPKAP